MRVEMSLTRNELSTTLESEIERLRAELLQANAKMAQISTVKRLDRRGKHRWLKVFSTCGCLDFFIGAHHSDGLVAPPGGQPAWYLP